MSKLPKSIKGGLIMGLILGVISVPVGFFFWSISEDKSNLIEISHVIIAVIAIGVLFGVLAGSLSGKNKN